jgi:DNA-binding MarR family transcriptional regulator
MTRSRDERRTIAEQPPEKEVRNCTALRKAVWRVRMLYDRALDGSALRVTQYAILAEIDRPGPMTMTELATAMVMERDGLGHNAGPLDRDRLMRIESRVRPTRVIGMTETGRQRVAEAKPLWRRVQSQFATAFEIAEIEGPRALLTTAVAANYGDTTAGC